MVSKTYGKIYAHKKHENKKAAVKICKERFQPCTYIHTSPYIHFIIIALNYAPKVNIVPKNFSR